MALTIGICEICRELMADGLRPTADTSAIMNTSERWGSIYRPKRNVTPTVPRQKSKSSMSSPRLASLSPCIARM
jgi:hypothetical protein